MVPGLGVREFVREFVLLPGSRNSLPCASVGRRVATKSLALKAQRRRAATASRTPASTSSEDWRMLKLNLKGDRLQVAFKKLLAGDSGW